MIGKPKLSLNGKGLVAAYFNRPFEINGKRYNEGWHSWKQGSFDITIVCLSDLMTPITKEILIDAGYNVLDER